MYIIVTVQIPNPIPEFSLSMHAADFSPFEKMNLFLETLNLQNTLMVAIKKYVYALTYFLLP